MHEKSFYINYEVRRDLGHEYMKCNYNSMLKFILKIYSLSIISSRYEGTKIALTLDRARFTSHIAHITCQVKLVNIRTRDPKHCDLLLNFQSCEYSYVFEMNLTKDTKDGYKYFKEFFKWGREISKKGIPACNLYGEVMPIKVSFPVDLSAA